MIKRISRNVHFFNVPETTKRHQLVQYMLMSDLHWDNPKCNRDLLKKHLEYAKKHKIKVLINGDLFCLMQGKGDRRGSKSDIRPEHNNSKYLDSIITTAVEWFKPYADQLCIIGYGNHESSIIKWQETDLLDRFAFMLNTVAQPKESIYATGYGGWFVTSINKTRHVIKYYHGSGGGGPVTGGAIAQTRMQTMIHGADVIWQGHIHESEERIKCVESINSAGRILHKEILHITTPTYKEEYGDGAKGWHVERRAPVKPLGCRILEIEARQEEQGKRNIYQKSYKL